MDLIITIVIGGVIGWLASLAMKTDQQMGLVANVVVGIVGSVLGTKVIAPALGIGASSAIGYYGIMFGGAVLLIIGLRFLGIFR